MITRSPALCADDIETHGATARDVSLAAIRNEVVYGYFDT
jgi:hypothetical protein